MDIVLISDFMTLKCAFSRKSDMARLDLLSYKSVILTALPFYCY